MRTKLFNVIERFNNDNTASKIYDFTMIIVIILSLFPLTFKTECQKLIILDFVTTVIFITDYVLRWFTADLKLHKGAISFIIYPFTFLAILDLLCILPTFIAISPSLKILKIFRLVRAMKVFKAIKLIRYSKSMLIIENVIKSQSVPLITVCTLAIGYIFMSALIVFNIEPDTFNNFYDAIYWTTISLTTMGDGDIYPISCIGRLFTMLSALMGIAIVALPAGIITAGYMNEINNIQNTKE